MVIAGFGALASLGLALPTGLAFGYGYGYGVRQGYHAFRPSKSSVTKELHLSSDPIKGARGAGLLSAEEMTSKQATKAQPVIPTQPTPTPKITARKIEDAMATDRKRATPGHSNTPGTDQAYLKSKAYQKDHFVRMEAGAVTDAISKKKAWHIAYSAGIKDLSERNVRRLYIKRLSPFN